MSDPTAQPTDPQSTNAFEESPGQTSAQRVVFVPSALALAFTICFLLIRASLIDKPIVDGSANLIVIAGGFVWGGKLVQKHLENKAP